MSLILLLTRTFADMRKLLIAVALVALASPQFLLAQSSPIPMPGDNRLVQFMYSANETYTILTRPFSSTHIEMGPDEVLELVALGDTVKWLVAKTPKNLFIKPTTADIFTSATLITNKRSYQITLRSSPENGKWMQRVSWHYPESEMLLRVEQEARVKTESTQKAADAAVTPVTGLAPESMSFDYAIEGTAAFRPVTVFDDGKFVYLRFPPSSQELPALFTTDADGSLNLVNYVVKGDLVVMQRLAFRLLLKLGKEEVRITKRGAEPARRSGVLGFFGLR
jgi:type IV secretion system protein TrbG